LFTGHTSGKIQAKSGSLYTTDTSVISRQMESEIKLFTDEFTFAQKAAS
jgi:hypothetical protein